MTQRERQILQLIEQNPMVSQEELAEVLGITRSSVAVHISGNILPESILTSFSTDFFLATMISPSLRRC